MIFGNAAWGLRETPLEEQFKITHEMGLDILEIGIANAPMDIQIDITDEEIDNIKALAKKYEIKMLCAATGNDFTAGTEDIYKIKRVIDICKKMGTQNLRIFAGFMPLKNINDNVFDEMIKALISVCDYAEKRDVVTAIETHGAVNQYEDGVEHIPSVTTDLRTLKRIMTLLPQSAKLCFDPSNLYAAGIKNPEIFYQEFEDKIAYAHFKDFKKLPSGRLLPSYCGDGEMNWDKLLKAMRKFKGAALFEYENTKDVKYGLKKCHDYIRERI